MKNRSMRATLLLLFIGLPLLGAAPAPTGPALPSFAELAASADDSDPGIPTGPSIASTEVSALSPAITWPGDAPPRVAQPTLSLEPADPAGPRILKLALPLAAAEAFEAILWWRDDDGARQRIVLQPVAPGWLAAAVDHAWTDTVWELNATVIAYKGGSTVHHWEQTYLLTGMGQRLDLERSTDRLAANPAPDRADALTSPAAGSSGRGLALDPHLALNRQRKPAAAADHAVSIPVLLIVLALLNVGLALVLGVAAVLARRLAAGGGAWLPRLRGGDVKTRLREELAAAGLINPRDGQPMPLDAMAATIPMATPDSPGPQADLAPAAPAAPAPFPPEDHAPDAEPLSAPEAHDAESPLPPAEVFPAEPLEAPAEFTDILGPAEDDDVVPPDDAPLPRIPAAVPVRDASELTAANEVRGVLEDLVAAAEERAPELPLPAEPEEEASAPPTAIPASPTADEDTAPLPPPALDLTAVADLAEPPLPAAPVQTESPPDDSPPVDASAPPEAAADNSNGDPDLDADAEHTRHVLDALKKRLSLRRKPKDPPAEPESPEAAEEELPEPLPSPLEPDPEEEVVLREAASPEPDTEDLKFNYDDLSF